MIPLALPDTPSGIHRVNAEPERVDYGAPEASGRQGGVQAGWPLWGMIFEFDRVDPESADMWRAFFARLRGRQRRFHSGEPTRPYPILYRQGFAGLTRSGGGTFDGSAAGWNQNIDGDGNSQIALSGLPASLQLKIGDYIGWKWDDADEPAGNLARRTMARLVLPATASAGGALTAVVEPPIDTRVVPANAIAHLDRPMCVMQLIPEKSKLGPIITGSVLGGGTIVATQDLRP